MMLRKKFANMPGWKRILQHRFYHSYVDTPEFRGNITLYYMDAVTEPRMVEYFHRKTCIFDAGYSWLKQFPADEQHFNVSTHFDASGQIVQWYIDICLHTGIDQNQIPWIDDLYLDLVVSPTMEIEVKDADELLAARESGDISTAEFDLAWREARRIMERIKENQFGLLALSNTHRQMLLQSDPLLSK
jgi:predicted RNA-binding protein associated with RNAse of E/G family